jgi:hypothetical protein
VPAVVIGFAVACVGPEPGPSCANGPIQPAWVSARAPIVEYVVPSSQAVYSAPELIVRTEDNADPFDITVLYSENPFDPPPQVVQGDGGALAVSGAGILAYVDTRYRILRPVGGAPGLYHIGYATGAAVWARDTIVTFDANAARLTWQHPDRGFVRTQLLPLLVRDLLWATPTGMLPGRRLVLHSQWTPRFATIDSVVRPPVPVAVLDSGSYEPRVIARPPGYELAATEVRGANAVHV